MKAVFYLLKIHTIKPKAHSEPLSQKPVSAPENGLDFKLQVYGVMRNIV